MGQLGAAVRKPQLAPALGLVAATWGLLLLVQSATSGILGNDRAAGLSFVLAATLVLACRARGRGASRVVDGLLLVLGGVAGLATYRSWLVATWWSGSALGLGRIAAAPWSAGFVETVCFVGVAPVLEELLYRERLLEALRGRWCAAVAVPLSAAAFAAPHVQPWQVLATFGVGVLLGALWCATRALSLCVGYHAGLNLDAALSAELVGTPLVSLGADTGVGVALLALGIAASRSRTGPVPPAARRTR